MLSSRTCRPSGSTPTLDPSLGDRLSGHEHLSVGGRRLDGQERGHHLREACDRPAHRRVSLPEHLAGAEVEKQPCARRVAKGDVDRVRVCFPRSRKAGERERGPAQRQARRGQRRCRGRRRSPAVHARGRLSMMDGLGAGGEPEREGCGCEYCHDRSRHADPPPPAPTRCLLTALAALGGGHEGRGAHLILAGCAALRGPRR